MKFRVHVLDVAARPYLFAAVKRCRADDLPLSGLPGPGLLVLGRGFTPSGLAEKAEQRRR
jgi:hypothetical protein